MRVIECPEGMRQTFAEALTQLPPIQQRIYGFLEGQAAGGNFELVIDSARLVSKDGPARPAAPAPGEHGILAGVSAGEHTENGR